MQIEGTMNVKIDENTSSYVTKNEIFLLQAF